MLSADLQILEQLQQRCQHNHQRGLVVVSGQQSWVNDTAAKIITLFPQHPLNTIDDPVSATQLLGDETNGIIFNAFKGLNLNALAISAGTIKGGGLMYLLCPALSEWSAFDDPEYQRLLAHPYTAADVDGRFLQRFQQQLQDDPHTLIISENQNKYDFTLPAELETPATSSVAPYANQQQADATKAILTIVNQEQHIVIITADRGRGKSAALGLAAAELLKQNDQEILITAPSPKAIKTVLKHAQQDGFTVRKNELKNGTSRLKFISPDELILNTPPAHILLIDEAAAIPIPLLLEILTHYPRVVLTTTVHGYEGTGRAFSDRFGKLLTQQKLNWTKLQLDQAIRFAANDPLEEFLHNSLILNSKLAARYTENKEVKCTLVNRDQLITDEPQLRELFGLLMLAHYKTRPDDLRHLLEAPNLDVFVIKDKEHILGTAMVAREGQLEPELIDAIMQGKRRPKGHLLPQTLAFYCRLPKAARLTCARVIRIAIHPDVQRCSLGNQLLNYIEQYYKDANTDLIGSSFGLEPGVLLFWQQAGYHCVRVGHKRNAASGYHSGLLLKSLSTDGDSVCQQAIDQHQRESELSGKVEDKR